MTLAAEQRADEERSSSVVKHIYPADLIRLMKKHDHYGKLTNDDINLLMSRFDLDGDGRIGINEFYQQMEPHSQRKY